MLIRLGSVTFRGLLGKERTVTNEIERETEKAILLRRETYGQTSKRWIPRSVCEISPTKIEVAEWWWEKEGVR